jgi:hypothetical protein
MSRRKVSEKEAGTAGMLDVVACFHGQCCIVLWLDAYCPAVEIAASCHTQCAAETETVLILTEKLGRQSDTL